MKIGCVMRHDEEKMYGVGSRELSNAGCARARGGVVTKEGLGANSLRGCQHWQPDGGRAQAR